MSASTSREYIATSRYEGTSTNAPILIASDASPDSDAAFPMAMQLTTSTHAPVEVLSVLRPFSMPMYVVDATPVPAETEEAIRFGREGELHSQIERLVAPELRWPVNVVTGDPIEAIVGHAERIHAQVIVTGRGRHGAIERLLGGESIMRMLQVGNTPVLAVEDGQEWLPRRVAIATDFSEQSARAAKLACSLVAPDATVMLVHVAPPFDAVDSALHERADEYKRHAEREFARIRAELPVREQSVREILLAGNPSDVLLALLDMHAIELVALATHGYGFVRRMLLGSVAAAMIRRAPCSVLCVPGHR